jgi:hypothetical protein
VPVRVILTGAGAAIALILASYIGNNYALDNMQFRLREVGGFNFETLSSNLKLDACNPTAFPAGFDKFTAVVYYRGSEFATMSVDGGSVMPYQSSTFDGRIRLSAQIVSGLIIALAPAIGGEDTPYDENDISLKMSVESSVLGLVPHSQTREFTFLEFQEFMSTQDTGKYGCE